MLVSLIASVFLVTLFAPTTQAIECDLWDSFVASANCDPLFEGLSKIKPKSRTEYAVYAEQCDKAVKCLAENKCHYSNHGEIDWEDMCRYVRLNDINHYPCLKGFFRRAYLSQFSDDESCFKEFTSLTKSISLNQEEFINGKSCFLNYVEDNCNAAAQDYFSNRFDNFIKSIPKSANMGKCTNSHEAVTETFCYGLSDEYSDRLGHLNEPIKRSNSVYLQNTGKICKDFDICMQSKCINFMLKAVNKGSSTCHLLEKYSL